MKICILGHCGAGKSTLAEILGKKYSLPVLHLDATYWYGDWQNRTREEQSAIVKEFMNDNCDGWVIEGNYGKICLERFSECDCLYFLNYNRFFCLRQALARYKKYKGKVRPDCPCPEKFDAEFLFWILFKGRTASKRKLFKRLVSLSSGEKYILKNRRQLNKHLDKLCIYP